MKYAAFLCAFAGLALFSCNKNDGDNQNLNPNAQTKFDYMSSKEGSYWYYGGRDGVNFIRYARGRDTVKLGVKYSYYERKDDSAHGFQPEYFGRNGDSYLTLIDLDGDESHYIPTIFWKEGAVAGSNWENTGKISSPIGDVVTRISARVVEDNLTMTIGTHTYNKVAHVHSDLKGGPTAIGVGTLDIWMQKGTGIIRQEVDINILGQYTLQHTDSLLDYHIVP